MTSDDAGLLVPADFPVPPGLTSGGLHLELLGPQHNEADHAAWTSSIDHIKATTGWAGRGWPFPMSLADLVMLFQPTHAG